jgi:Zn-dependent peptidase ImmA (M78 family)
VRDQAMAEGEEIALVSKCVALPIDLMNIIKQEPLIHAEGDDFGDAFDGRLEYLGNRYLLVYNTKYNKAHSGEQHPRVRFTIAHELGHYFLDAHRSMLQKGGPQYTCTTEQFNAEKEMELQADYFATGLLMPSDMLAPVVNKIPEPDLAVIKQVAGSFNVSLTSMILRWVKLSDFPCAVFSVAPAGIIEWAWPSEAMARIGRCHKKKAIASTEALQFVKSTDLAKYTEGHGKGVFGCWAETEYTELSVEEFYAAMPYRNSTLIFIFAYEDELMDL